MKKAARFRWPKGFTLIEVILSVAILTIFLVLATPYLFGAKEKANLELERDKIVSALKIAQQKAIEAYQGYEYGLEFKQAEKQYTPISFNPTSATTQVVGRITTLPPNIEISSISTSTIVFERLSGKPSSTLNLTLTSKKFKVEINVSEAGMITSTNPEKIL